MTSFQYFLCKGWPMCFKNVVIRLSSYKSFHIEPNNDTCFGDLSDTSLHLGMDDSIH